MLDFIVAAKIFDFHFVLRFSQNLSIIVVSDHRRGWGNRKNMG